MQPAIIKSIPSWLQGKISLPGDKSISHRAIFIASISKGKTKVNNFLFSQDSLATIGAFRKLGIKITTDKIKRQAVIYGRGLFGLSKPDSDLNLKESGTTMRILTGILAAQNFPSKLLAGSTLSRRPMRRVAQPLRLMGAQINSRIIRDEEYPPLRIAGGHLKAIDYCLSVPSAQVKSAIILAGLYASGTTCVREKIKSRDHTERMLKLFKANIKRTGLNVSIKRSELTTPGAIDIPSDISSAAFFMVLASLFPRSNLLIKSVGANPTRTGIVTALKQMGANIKVKSRGHPKKKISAAIEPMADLEVKGNKLKGTIIKPHQVPSLIDELPILMVATALAKGKTVIEGVSELKIKETDRINSMVSNLVKMGAKIKVKKRKDVSSSLGRKGKCKEYIEIVGVDKLKGAKVRSFSDHRTAMSMIVAGLLAEGKTYLDDIDCISKSFPEFVKIMKGLLGRRCINT